MGRAGRAQVVSCLQAAQPRQFVGVVEFFAGGARHVNVQRLGLINPLLATRCGFDNPSGFHFKRCRIQGFDFLRNAVDRAQ